MGVAIAVYLLLLGLAVVWGKNGEETVTRPTAQLVQTAQLVMLTLVVVVSLGVPLAAVLRFADEDVWSGTSLAVAMRILQVAFVALATMLPGLLFFFSTASG